MFISGIQQMGIGVSDVHAAFKWYNLHFGMDVPIFEEAATAGLMLPYTGGEPRDRHAILAINMQGGGGMEIWQYTSRKPEAPQFQPLLGDLGINIAKIKTKNAEVAFHFLRKKGVNMLSNPSARPDGKIHFFVKDPYGNPFEVVEAADWLFPSNRHECGGIYGATIGVSDLDRSKLFYQTILGYDQVVYDQTGQFEDLHGTDGGFSSFRRCLLRHSEQRKGPFSPLFGSSEIELVQCLDRAPRKIFEGRYWGDLGYIHLCFDITGMSELKSYCASKGHPFTVDSSGSFDMGEAAGYFSYIEDPDGTLIEFVETHKIPLLKKLGWYLDLRKRSNPEKPLPRLLLRALGLGRVKFDSE